MPVHQFLPSLSRGDAIGNHVLRIRPLLERFGPSRIYVESCDSALRTVAVDYRTYAPEPGTTILYHASIGTPMAGFLLRNADPVVIDYHNVTPMRFYAAYEPRIAALLHSGRVDCRQLAGRSPLGIADSDYSARELESMGYRSTATVPILIDFEAYGQPADQRLLDRLLGAKRGTDVLFVGRVSPNKRQEDVIKAFTLYRRHYDPGARLFLVGKTSSSRYLETLESFVARLGAAGISLVGEVSEPELFAYYRAADVFVSMSEHEGFCVPLVECMLFGVPVVAYAAAAVPETLGDAGILVHEKRYEEVAALVHLVAREPDVREGLLRAGRERLEHFRPERHEPRLIELIGSVAG